MRSIITKFFILSFLTYSCTSKYKEERDLLSDPFLGLKPSDSVRVLAPNIISTDQFEYNGTFSPDGSEFYYTVNLPNRGQIVFLNLQEDNDWSEPKFAEFSSKYSEVDSIFSPDGMRLYFTSSRPTPESTDLTRNNIWYVERTENGWSRPQYVALTESGDYYSSITNHGDVYFNTGNGDIYKAVKTDSTHLIERLPDIINLNKSVADPFISPDEDYLIFRGNNLENAVGITDLYISFKVNNEWTEPLNLGEPITSTAREMSPYI
jgi:Tol biopolymer transport system component